MSFTSFMLRAMSKRGDDKRVAGCTTPSDIQRFDDLVYGPDPRWNVLDVYRPRDAKGPLPVIVSVHGGGWVYGDKDRYQYYCMSLAQQGFAVVNFSYRLAPRYKFPAPVEDTNRVFSWVLDYAGDYGFDTRHIFGVGDSAGAHLLAMYSCICTDPAYAAMFPLKPPPGFVPTAIALNCGVYRIQKEGKKDLTARLMADYLPGKGTDEELRQINVLGHLNRDFPPAFVMTAEGDFLAHQAKPMVDALQTLGITAEYHYYGDKEHVLGHVFHCDTRSEAAKLCNREECSFFRKYLNC